MERKCWVIFTVLAILDFRMSNATLISSSKIVICGRETIDADPKELDGKRCSRKFVVALTVENGKVSETACIVKVSCYSCVCFFLFFFTYNLLQNASGAIYARLKYVDNERTGESDREQLTRPFRIIVSKSEVRVKYPLRDINVSFNYIKRIGNFRHNFM